MSVYDMQCTVCGRTCEDREEWIGHLVKESHQTQARNATLNWGEDERKRIIVVFTTCSMGSIVAHTLLQYVTMETWNTVVNDFIWWPERREKTAILQLGSVELVNRILKRKENRKIEFPDYCVQFQKASKYLELEWNQLFGNIGKGVGLGAGEIEDDDVQEPNEVQREKENAFSTVNGEILNADRWKTTGMLDLTSNHLSPLTSKFQTLLTSAESPNEHYLENLRILDGVRKALGTEYEVNMFRNFVLQLQNSSNNVLLLHVQYRDQYRNSFDTKDEQPNSSIVKSILNKRSSKQYLSGFQEKTLRVPLLLFEGTLYINRQSGFRFALTTNRSQIVEVQVSRMINYLNEFDSRLKSLLSLVYIWFRSNDIRLGETRIDSDHLHSHLPEPAVFDWIVVIFLNQEGIIPTVQEIVNRPHEILRLGVFDYGFDCDPAFVKEWKSRNPPVPEEGSQEYVWNVLNLAKNFFNFLMKLISGGNWVLNPRHGEVYKRNDFLDGMNPQTQSRFTQKLCWNDVKSVREEMDRLVKRGVEDHEKYLIMKNRAISILHPFDPHWRISFNDEIDKKDLRRRLQATVTRLEAYLVRSNGSDCMETALVGPDAISRLRMLGNGFTKNEAKDGHPSQRKGIAPQSTNKVPLSKNQKKKIRKKKKTV